MNGGFWILVLCIAVIGVVLTWPGIDLDDT